MSAGAGFSALAAAYEGIDERDSFDDATLSAYRETALRRSEVQADFIQSAIQPGGTVVEVGCGNGRLLIALVERRAIANGLGVDLASSRIEFARAWASDRALQDRLTFEVDDAAARDFGTQIYRAAVVVTGALGYFDAYVPGSAKQLIGRLARSLVTGGGLVLELYPHPRERQMLDINAGQIKIWSELGRHDPWRFYLNDLRLENDVLVHEKTFIRRADGFVDQGRSERLVLYTPETVTALLGRSGFSDVRCLAGWSHEPYAGGDVLVVTARTS